ncbi:hypothetical protein SALBM311S_13076 [Streptomyces alboniger]
MLDGHHDLMRERKRERRDERDRRREEQDRRRRRRTGAATGSTDRGRSLTAAVLVAGAGTRVRHGSSPLVIERRMSPAGQIWFSPPSTYRLAPRMKLLSSEARKTTASADLVRASDPAQRGHLRRTVPW